MRKATRASTDKKVDTPMSGLVFSYRIDPKTGEFVNTKTNEPMTRDEVRSLITEQRNASRVARQVAAQARAAKKKERDKIKAKKDAEKAKKNAIKIAALKARIAALDKVAS